MMGTRAAAFAGKISNLRESLLRIQNGTMPQPTCLDLANMLKYFSQVLHDFRDFKDIENVTLYASEKRDQSELIKTLPNFDYCGLYKTLHQLIDILPLIPQTSNGLDQLGSNLLMLFKCLVPFLDQANMETMPLLVSTLFMSLPQALHKDILDTLCFNLLPFTIDQQQRHSAALMRQAARRSAARQSRSSNARIRRRQSNRPINITAAQLKEEMGKPVHCIVHIEDSSADQPKVSVQAAGSQLESSSGTHDRQEDQGIHMEPDEQMNEGELAEAGEAEDSMDQTDAESDSEEDYALLSVTGILTIFFHYIQEPQHHSQMIECLMKLKNNVFEDLLYVIAYGTTRARCPAVELLFRYWPDISPSQQEKKSNSQGSRLKHIAWPPTKCQNKNCSLTTLGDDDAVKMCLDFKLSIALGDLPPPLLVCLDCVDSIYKQHCLSGVAGGTISSASNDEPVAIYAIEEYGRKFVDLLLPMERVAKLCENKKCRSTDRTAIGTCFDIECANYNCKRPIRYCKTCFKSIHEPCESNNWDMTLQSHIRHSSIILTIMDDEESVNNFIEAIISLLKEAAPADKPSKDSERYLRSLMGPGSQFGGDNKDQNLATEEKQLISQYGIWLMTGLCESVSKISDELLGRLLGMLFQWFHFTACLPDDQAGSALEKLKGECIKGWIMGVKEQRLDVFISCLLPHPIDCSKIGGHWEVWPDTAHQIKEGFKRLLCLVPYDIITDDVWDEIMPYWMECFRHEVPENELSELKILLSKVFDPELSPLGFETKQMYNFISSRFEDVSNTSQEQTLYWLQIITMLEIPIPIDFLFQMLKSGVKSLAQIRDNELNKIKIANRLAELDQMSTTIYRVGRSSASTSPTSSRSARGSSDSSSSAGSSQAASSRGASGGVPGAVANDEDDDVLMENSKDPTNILGPPTQEEHQARVAQARANFNARVLQHASQLAAQVSQSGDSNSLSQSSTVTQIANQPSLSVNAALAPATGQRGPLKSTTSSVSSLRGDQNQANTSTKKPQTNSKAADQEKAKTKDKQHQSRPKLRLQLTSVDDYMANKIDNNLVCYILMVDILLKQLDLQEINSHRGLEGKEAHQAIELLNTIISTPWLGKHTCCEALANGSSGSPSVSDDQRLASVTSSNATPRTPGASDTNQRSAGKGNANEALFGKGDSVTTSLDQDQEESYETCVFCEIISTFHQLSMSLIEFFAPVIEVSICEMSNDAANGEFSGKPDYGRIGLDHLGPSPSPDSKSAEFSFNPYEVASRKAISSGAQQQDGQGIPISPSYFGPSLKPEVLRLLPMELQLSYNLLVQFHQYQTPDIVSQLLQMIKLMSLHSQVFSKAAKQEPQFIAWCQHNMLINKLWSLCQLESSEIARTCVPLLLHCITLPWGVRLFRDLVERDFNSDQWLSRFNAVGRVVTIAYFCDPSSIKNSNLLQSTMASAFCYLVRCLDDIEATVADRALVSLEMMKTSSLKLLLWCLEVQFDFIVIDRPMILRCVFQLYNHLKDRRFFTWDFFLNRFDTVFLEAQIYLQQTGEIPSFTMQDLKNTNTKSEIYQKKIARAREALQQTHHSRSLFGRLCEVQFCKPADDQNHFYRQVINLQRRHQQLANLAAETSSLGVPSDSASASKSTEKTSPARKVIQHGCSASSRYQSVALLTSQSIIKRKNSKFMANLALQSVPPMMLPDKLHQHLPNSFMDDGSKLNEIAQENHVFGVVHRLCDEDRDTNHSLIFLLMQFFSKPDLSHPQSLKTMNRSHQIVLRHLNILMGYSVARKNFLIAATNLRLLPTFNALLTSLPKVLDFNYSLGTILLDTCLPILIYCPAPEDTQYDSIKVPTYSLWLLNPLMRQSWLMSVMTFLYKYQFNEPHLKEHVNRLIWIVINTLESHLTCSTMDASLGRLLNIRDSSAAISQPSDQTAIITEDHTKVHSSGSQDTSSGGHQITSGTVVESSSRQRVEEVELKTSIRQQSAPRDQSEHSSVTATGASTSSLTLQKSDTTAKGISPRTDSIPVSGRALIKADTSDNLNVKSKLFQRKSDTKSIASDGSKIVSAGCSSTRINMAPTETPKMIRQPEAPINTSDERLLPIGGHRAHSTFDLPSAERLLPIGLSNAPVERSGSPVGGCRDLQSSGVPTEPHRVREPIAAETDPRSQVVTVSPEPGAVPASTSLVKIERETCETPEPISSSSTCSKPAKRRFGAGNRHAFGGGDNKSISKDIEQPQEGTSKIQASTTFSVGGRKAHKSGAGKLTKEYIPPGSRPAGSGASGVKASFSSPSLLNEQLAQINRHSSVQEFSDKDLSMCLVILETFIHHEPSMAAQMLPNILRLVARYSSASQDSWQSGSNMHLVGGSVFVARQFIRVALHDLMENNIFHQIFTSHFTGYDFYKSMATALADFNDLNQLSPLSKLFEDLNRQKNLPQPETLMTILENVATYFECIISESSNYSQSTWANFVANWENFLRKLYLALPRYSGSMPPGRADLGASTGAAASQSLIGGGGGFIAGGAPTGQGGIMSGAHPGAGGASIASSSQFVISRGANQDGLSVGSGLSACSMIMSPIMRIILATTKIPHLASCKTIVDPYSKIVSYTVLNSPFKYEYLLEINHNCCRLYARDREKYLIQRTIAYELVQVLKFRFYILEENLLILLLFVLQDVSGTLAPKVVHEGLKLDQATLNQADSYITNVSECLRQYIGDLLEFITDVHAISRINDNLVGSQPSPINRDSFGGHVKAAISQYLALEMSLSSGSDNRTVLRYLPWLYTSPSLQQGPREFIECVSHIRQLSWIILGSLQHSTLVKFGQQSQQSSGSNMTASTHHSPSSQINCQPIPIEKNGNVAEHVHVILAGFAEQSKESVLHMSGLFHAFLLCQLWTMYCETTCSQHPANSEQYQFCQSTLDDFWAKITPGVLRLVGHSRVMSEMVSTHFLQLIESLIESNSSILIRYLPMWNSVFYSYKRRNKSGNIAIRLQKCIEWQPPDLNAQDAEQNNKRLINWLEKVQYKMSHIEIQSSQAAPYYLT